MVARRRLALAALLFSFDGISGEKEGGTLKLQLSSGSSRIAILLGKLLGRWSLVVVPFVLLFAAAAVIVSLLPEVTADPTYWAAVAMIMLLSGLYALVFVAFAVDVLYLVPVALVYNRVKEFVVRDFVELVIFVGILSLVIVYAWKKGIFEWKRRKIMPKS